MARVLTNNFSLAYAEETTIGVLPAQPVWKLLEPNAINTFGSTITTVERSPISKNRQRRKGTITDLDSAVEFDADWTMDSFEDFISGFVMAIQANATLMVNVKSGALSDNLAAVAATDNFTHDALSAALAEGTLIKTRGFANTANNGLFAVDAAGTTTSTITVAGTLVDETPSNEANASMEVAGFRFTDLTWDDTAKQIGSVLIDLSTLGLSVGQFIRVGSTTNDFTNGAIWGRITAITAALITLDKITNISTGTLDGGGNEVGSSVDLLYGRFYKNVPVDDSDFIERYFQFEGTYPDLGGVGTDEYEYALGNLCNVVTFNLPLTDKATVSYGFVGTDTDDPTTSRATNGATPQDPVKTGALNTSADFARLRITEVDETGLTTDFKSMSLALGNNVSPEKILGLLGAKYMNTGNFEVDIETEVIFTDPAVPAAIRANRTVTMEFCVENDDGGVFVDIPAMTLGGGGKSFPVNESILITLQGTAFEDPTLGTSIGVSLFPHLP